MRMTHVSPSGKAKMVDISGKSVVHREAQASGKVFLQPQTLTLIRKNAASKGDVLAVARVAAISGAKRTSDLIPLCHNIPISRIDLDFKLEKDGVAIAADAVCDAKTGIEMEALTAVAIAGLTIYDMCKAVDKKMRISEITLVKKSKRRSSDAA